MNWDDYFRAIAHVVKLKSKDINTQIGSVIVRPDHSIMSTGYNSFPRGINDDCEERQDQPEKYYWLEHAERNGIFNAARIGVSTDGCTMYLSCGTPCADCARAIIQAGIVRIVLEHGLGAKGEHWKEHEKRSLQMFKEADVQIDYYATT